VADDQLIVITGASGHVGGRLFMHFCTATDRHVRPHFRAIIPLPTWAVSHTATLGDLREHSVRMNALRDADVVIHLATRGYSSSKPPSPSQLAAERAATVDLIRDAAASGVSRFVLVSSIHVLGDALVGDVTDFTTPLPTTDYGRSRLELEREVKGQSLANSMTGIVLRMTNTFGVPAIVQPSTWDLLIHDLCRQAVTSDRLVLHSNGSGYRNFLALSDAVNVITEVATHTVPSGTYLLAGPQTFQLREVAETVRIRAEHLLQKSLTVDVNTTDMTRHQPFTVKGESLRALGIVMQDNFIGELDRLILAARKEFGEPSS